MAQKHSEIIEEQRKAREEFLKLKKMQSGEIEPEAKPSELTLKPQTFKEKVQNYWYHYKVQTLLSVFLVAVVSILVAQCAGREKYDFSVMYFVYTPAIDSQLDKVEEYFEAKATDLNGDGIVNVNVINCSVSPKSTDVNYRNTIFSKVQATIAAERSTVMYIIDESSQKYFEQAFEKSLFAEAPLVLGNDFLKATAVDGVTLPDDLKLALRVVEGTTFENDKKVKTTFDECKRIFDEIKKQNS